MLPSLIRSVRNILGTDSTTPSALVVPRVHRHRNVFEQKLQHGQTKCSKATHRHTANTTSKKATRLKRKRYNNSTTKIESQKSKCRKRTNHGPVKTLPDETKSNNGGSSTATKSQLKDKKNITQNPNIDTRRRPNAQREEAAKRFTTQSKHDVASPPNIIKRGLDTPIQESGTDYYTKYLKTIWASKQHVHQRRHRMNFTVRGKNCCETQRKPHHHARFNKGNHIANKDTHNRRGAAGDVVPILVKRPHVTTGFKTVTFQLPKSNCKRKENSNSLHSRTDRSRNCDALRHYSGFKNAADKIQYPVTANNCLWTDRVLESSSQRNGNSAEPKQTVNYDKNLGQGVTLNYKLETAGSTNTRVVMTIDIVHDHRRLGNRTVNHVKPPQDTEFHEEIPINGPEELNVNITRVHSPKILTSVKKQWFFMNGEMLRVTEDLFDRLQRKELLDRYREDAPRALAKQFIKSLIADVSEDNGDTSDSDSVPDMTAIIQWAKIGRSRGAVDEASTSSHQRLDQTGTHEPHPTWTNFTLESVGCDQLSIKNESKKCSQRAISPRSDRHAFRLAFRKGGNRFRKFFKNCK